MSRCSLCLAVLGGFIVSAAHAASFDCTRAARPVEKLICRTPKLNAADGQMGLAYRAGLAKLPPAEIGLLRADQVAWLAWMQEVCRVPEPDGSKQRPPKPQAEVADCMMPLYTDRTKQLRGIVVERNGVMFLTRTQYLATPDPEWKDRPGPDFSGFGTMQVSWPLALSDSTEWQAWNSAAEQAAYDMSSADPWSAGIDAPKTPQWKANLATGADTHAYVLLRRTEHDRVTTSNVLTTMGHGAVHPSESSATTIWLLQERRPLRAGDVFVPGNAWKRIVAQTCWHAIHTGDKKEYVYAQVNGPDAKDLQRVIADTGNWTLEHDGLHISYPEYSVSPRIANMDDSVVPWSALQPVLAKGFIAP